MNSALTTTLSLLSLIVIGYLFQRKIRSKEQVEGIKTLILSLALPATILIALLQIDFQSELIIIPILSLGFNLAVYVLMTKLPLQRLTQMPVHQYRTLIMLVPSLAPGLSCFPFIVEYSGQGPLAMAALADVGNKIFVLIISYTIAMKWYYEVNHEYIGKKKSSLKRMLITLVNEPVNFVILVAIAMLIMGANYASFPAAVTLSIDRLSSMMTPLILLFIGLSVKLSWSQVKTILLFLFFRSGIALAISGCALYLLNITDPATALLIVVFPQSACSFWPYAHMTAVTQIENHLRKDSGVRTFDQDFAMNVLACSLPFSVLFIIGIYSSGNLFTTAAPVLTGSLIFLIAGAVVFFFSSSLLAEYRSNAFRMAMKIEPKEDSTSQA